MGSSMWTQIWEEGLSKVFERQRVERERKVKENDEVNTCDGDITALL